MKTKNGRAALLAQEEMITVCDRLYSTGKITLNQLLYLRHMVLIREDVIAAIYDDYQTHHSITLMAKHLFEVANMRSNMNQNASANAQDDTEDEDDEGDDVLDNDLRVPTDNENENDILDNEEPTVSAAGMNNLAAAASRPSSRPQAPSPMSATLNAIITTMMRSGQLTAVEATVLSDMVNAENEYVGAAFEMYEQDGDEDELKETLMRCAKLEFKKRVAASRGARLRYQQYLEEHRGEAEVAADMKAYDQNFPSVGEDEEDDGVEEDANQDEEEEGEDGGNDEEDDAADVNGDYEEEDEDSDDDDDDDYEDGNGANSFSDQLSRHLTDLLDAVDAKDTWSEQGVPQQFIFTVFAAAHKKLLSVAQSKALCDLYQANYDLVKAAWEVFSVQGDVRDLTDTLLRIVRDLEFGEGEDGRLVGTDPVGVVRVSAKGISGASGIARSGVASVTTSASLVQTEREEKRKAREAVLEAKKDLVAQSLEMMIKRGMTEASNAKALLDRVSRGDVLVDAAIEAYSNDKDVSEFLDTLQILANNDPDELDDIIRSAASNQAKEEQKVQSAHQDQGRRVGGSSEIQVSMRSPGKAVATTTSASPVSGSASHTVRSPEHKPVVVSVTSTASGSNSPLRSPGQTQRSPVQAQRSPIQSQRSPVQAQRSPVHPNSNISNSNGLSATNGAAPSPSKGTVGRTNIIAQGELRRVIAELVQHRAIDDETELMLNRLVNSCDDRLMAAHDVYRCVS